MFLTIKPDYNVNYPFLVTNSSGMGTPMRTIGDFEERSQYQQDLFTANNLPYQKLEQQLHITNQTKQDITKHLVIVSPYHWDVVKIGDDLVVALTYNGNKLVNVKE